MIAAAAPAFWIGSLLVGIAYLLTIACVVDAVRIPDAAWDRAEQSRRAWVGLMLVLPIVFVPYVFSIRPQLLATTR